MSMPMIGMHMTGMENMPGISCMTGMIGVKIM